MNRRSKYLAGSACALSLLAGLAVLQNDVNASRDKSGVAASSDANVASTMPALTGASAGMLFIDADGMARLPSAEEHAELAAAFQADLADLTRKKKIPSGSKKERSGAVSAVVATRKIQYLVVNVDENGQASFEHSSMNEEGHIDTTPTNELPEM